MNDQEEKVQNELDRVEEELIEEAQKSKKTPMPVSGRSVFEIKRIKDKKTTDHK